MTLLEQAKLAAKLAFAAGNSEAFRHASNAVEAFDAAREARTLPHGTGLREAQRQYRKGKAAMAAYMTCTDDEN